MIGSLRARFFVILLVPLLLGAVLSAVAVYDYVRETHVRLARERLAVIAADVTETIQSSVDLGLGLSALPQIQRRIERVRQINHGISAVTVYVIGGVVQFSTDRATIGELIPREWLAPDGQLRSTAWSAEIDQEILVGSPVINSFHQPVAGVVLRVSAARLGLDQMPSFRLVGAIGVTFLVFAGLLALIAARVMARLVAAPLAAATESLGVAAAAVRDSTLTEEQDDDLADPLARDVGRIVVPINAAEQALRKIDETV